MRFRMLGPLEVRSAGESWAGIGAAKWRSLLACLLLRPGQVVPTETLIAELWGDTPPPTANNLVSIYVHRLRGVIGDPGGEILAYRKPGYQLRVNAEDTDLGVFETLAGQARGLLADGDAEAAAARLREAEDLWRGELLADVTPTILVTTESERAGELRLTAAELRIEAELRCGRHSEVIPGLRSLVAENPLREGLWLLLMRALDSAGRHAEALGAYGHARTVISGELGVDPGPELQSYYADLLAADEPPPAVPPQRRPAAVSRAGEGIGAREPDGGTEPETPAGGPDSAEPLSPFPAQLPPDIGDFTGRAEEVSQLSEMLTRPGKAGGPGAVRIAVVAGAAGLGKTTLAVHTAHQVRDLFSDGQLYVDLSGASADPVASGEVLARFLRDLGVDGDKVPAGDGERAAMYRTRLTGRRMLIVLDNARDAAQVRPLLPGSESCAVLITSRNRMPDLAGPQFFDLNVLSDDEALELFARVVADGRPAAEPDATAEVLLACAGLPLAIRICAARLAARRQWKVATLASRLRNERHRLDELQTGDLAVRASFQVSYDALRAGRHRIDAARAFCLLGLWPGQTISLPAAAALIGGRESGLRAILETLVDTNLLESPAPDRYGLHDLLRVYATELAEATESEGDRTEAVGRLLSWYLCTADRASGVVAPNRYVIPMEVPSPAGPVQLRTVADALAWYDSERANVIVAVRQASALGLHDVAWRLGAGLFPLFNRRHNFADCITVNQIAVESARQAGQRTGEAWALYNLGQALAMIRDERAITFLESALAIRRQVGDRAGEAQSAVAVADAYYKIHGAEAAIEHSMRCLTVLREVGNAFLLGIGLNNHGEYCLELNRLPDAGDCFREAHEIFREIDGSGYQGYALHNLGQVNLRSGRLDEAFTCLREAREIHRASGNLIGQAIALKNLAEAHHENGDMASAEKSASEALALVENLKKDDAEVAEIREALESFGNHHPATSG